MAALVLAFDARKNGLLVELRAAGEHACQPGLPNPDWS
jgi:hypothetical protein